MKALLGVFALAFSYVVTAAPRIAVVDFDTHEYSSQLQGAQLADFVMDELVNTGLFEVVEREKLDTIMSELGLGASGMVDMSSAAQMGRLLGARYLMTGRVISLGAEEKTFNGYGISTRNTVMSLVVSVRIVDTETGSVAFSTRTTSQRTINEAGGLQHHSSNAYTGLAEEAAVGVVTEVERSPRFALLDREPESAAPNMVEVTFASSPAGADVEVDGVFYGNAGSTLRVPEGLRLVRVSLAGHIAWEKKVMVVAGQKLTATLAKAAE